MIRRWAGSARQRDRALVAVGLIGFLVIWQLVGSANARLYSTPTRVVAAIVSMVRHDDLLGLALSTTGSLALGWLISVILGGTLGVLMGRFVTLDIALTPYVSAFYALPRIAFVPLLVIWFGLGQTMILMTIVLTTAIMMVFPVMAGVRTAVHAYAQVTRSFCMPGRRVFARVLIPASVPFILTGMRLGVQRALMGVIIAQFMIGYPGLGTLIDDARIRLNVDETFAVALVSLFVGVVLTSLVTAFERLVLRWRPAA